MDLDFFQQMPKVSLHNHLEGAVRPETFLEVGRAKGIPLPADTVEEIRPFVQITGEEQNLVDFLAKIDRVTAITQTEDTLIRIVEEIVEDAAQDNVRYLELRGGPLVHIKGGLTSEHVLRAILTGLASGEKKHGVLSRFIVCALRSDDPEENVKLARLAGKYRDQGVVGFDLAGDEAGFPAKLHREAFRVAREQGLRITVHAGEAAGPESVVSAIHELKAERIGHGIRSIEDPQVVNLLINKGVALEICPTSNVHTKTVPSLDHHPIRQLYDMGIPIIIGDDDPQVSNITLSGELRLLHQRFGFTLQEICNFQLQAVQHCFLPEKEKQQLHDRISRELAVYMEM